MENFGVYESHINSGVEIIEICHQNTNNFKSLQNVMWESVYDVSNFDTCRLSQQEKLNSRCAICRKEKNRIVLTNLICSSCDVPSCAECYDCHRRKQLICNLVNFQKQHKVHIKISSFGIFLKSETNKIYNATENKTSKNCIKFNFSENLQQEKNFPHRPTVSNVSSPIIKAITDFNFEAFKPAINLLKETYGAVSESMFDDKGQFKCMFFQDSYMKDFFNFYPKRVCIDVSCTLVSLNVVIYLFLSEDSNGQSEIISVALISGKDFENLRWLLTVFKKHNPRWREIKMLVVDSTIKNRDILKNCFPDAYILICLYQSIRTFRKDLNSNDFCNLSEEQKNNILKYFEKMILSYSEMEYNLLYQQLFAMYSCIHKYFDANWHCIKSQWRIRIECGDYILYAMNAFLNFIDNSFRPVFSIISDFCELIHKFFFTVKLLRIERYQKNPLLFQSVQLSLYSKFTPQYHISKTLTPYIAEIIIHHLDMSSEININPGNLLENYVFCRYGITAVSNALACTCKFFMLTSLFCCHIFAVRRVLSLPIFDEALCDTCWTQSYHQSVHTSLKDSFSQNTKNIPRVSVVDKLLLLILNCSPNLYQQRIFLLGQLLLFWKKGEDVYLQFDGSDVAESGESENFVSQIYSVYLDNCSSIMEESTNSELFDYSKELNSYIGQHIINSCLDEEKEICKPNIFSTDFWLGKHILQGSQINFVYLSKVICKTKRSCVEWLQYMSFLPNSMTCPLCGNNMKLEVESKLLDGVVWICISAKKNKKNCSKRCTVRRDTWFEGTNLSLEQILYFTYMWINSYSSHQIIFELGISSATYSVRDKFFKRVCTSQQLEDQGPFADTIIDKWRQIKTGQDIFIAFLKDASVLYRKEKATYY